MLFMTDYAVSVRWYDENGNWEGVQWQLSQDETIKLCEKLEKQFGKGNFI